MKAQSSGVVITEENSPVVSPHDSNKASAVLVQSQLKGVNKVILSERVSIPDSVRHLKGLHVAHLVVTPVGKTVPIRIANTTTEDIEISKGCKFCSLAD